MSEYQDLYLKSNTLMLFVVFQNFRKMCQDICEWDPSKLLSAQILAYQAALKKKKRIIIINGHWQCINGW